MKKILGKLVSDDAERISGQIISVDGNTISMH